MLSREEIINRVGQVVEQMLSTGYPWMSADMPYLSSSVDDKEACKRGFKEYVQAMRETIGMPSFGVIADTFRAFPLSEIDAEALAKYVASEVEEIITYLAEMSSEPISAYFDVISMDTKTAVKLGYDIQASQEELDREQEIQDIADAKKMADWMRHLIDREGFRELDANGTRILVNDALSVENIETTPELLKLLQAPDDVESMFDITAQWVAESSVTTGDGWHEPRVTETTSDVYVELLPYDLDFANVWDYFDGKTAQANHSANVQSTTSSEGDILYYARCSCGWQSSTKQAQEDAQEAATNHMQKKMEAGQ